MKNKIGTIGTIGTRYCLIQAITAKSVAQSWDEAKREWDLMEIYFCEEGFAETCICGHYPIKECCVLDNKLNRNTVIVGNVCVKRFIGINTPLIFDAVKRVAADRGKALNYEALEYMYKKGWVNEWEFKFYQDTWRKRVLTSKQLTTRKNINTKVLVKIFVKEQKGENEKSKTD